MKILFGFLIVVALTLASCRITNSRKMYYPWRTSKSIGSRKAKKVVKTVKRAAEVFNPVETDLTVVL